MSRKKIVVKLQDGKIVKGWTTDFRPKKDFFHLYPLKDSEKEELLDVEVSSLKAIFFVKDFAGNKSYKKVRTFKDQPTVTPSQHKVIVSFKDGENIYGTCHSYGLNRKGFFVYPIDPKDNNERIFVVRSAVESVLMMKFEGKGFRLIKKASKH